MHLSDFNIQTHGTKNSVRYCHYDRSSTRLTHQRPWSMQGACNCLLKRFYYLKTVDVSADRVMGRRGKVHGFSDLTKSHSDLTKWLPFILFINKTGQCLFSFTRRKCYFFILHCSRAVSSLVLRPRPARISLPV